MDRAARPLPWRLAVGEHGLVTARRRWRAGFTLRGVLFALLGVLALTVLGLLLVLITTQPPPPGRPADPSRRPTSSSAVQSQLLSEAAVPDAEGGRRELLVRLPPPPMPARMQALESLPSNMVGDPELRSFLREVDRAIAALDPATGYLAMLATQALRDETSRLRVVAESGGSAAALAAIRPVRSASELPADAQTLALLLRSILVTSAGGQQSLLNSVAGQPAITERIQQAREARALGRFIEAHDALEFGTELRNHVVLSAAIDRP
ncbi:MAG: hypothetical protein OXP73_02255 [Chloroflexota bacterium]|nr:hypothetical protein [Chloroflexota bacterium]